MNVRIRILPALLTIALLGLSASNGLAAALPAAYGQLPLRFEPNVGQAPAQVRYLARTGGYSVGLTARGVLLSVAPVGVHHSAAPGEAGAPALTAQLGLNWVNASRSPGLQPEQPLNSVSNYLIGDDPAQWHRHVANYGAVRYAQLYTGIDWRVYGNPQQLEYDLIVAPQADPGRIALNIDGASRLTLDSNGDLLIGLGDRKLRQLKPVIYQEDADGKRIAVSGRYQLDPQRHEVAFTLGQYDHSRTLVIDPALVYSTYLGGSADDYAESIAVDSAGSAYVAGYTTSSDFPVAGGVQKSSGGGSASGSVCACDAFVSKLTADGSALQYSTYLGGSGDDYAYAIAVDSSGSATVAGVTTSTNFPTANAVQVANGGGADGFVARLSVDGSSLVYSTYLGGKDDDEVHAVALDSAGNAYAAGYTNSTKFPAANPEQKKIGGGYDAFISKLGANGSLGYSTYLGGSGDDYAYGIAVDSAGNAYVVGDTTSTDFPTAAPYQKGNADNYDCFVTKLSADGSTLAYSTYLGGFENDHARAVAVDSSGAAYVVGYTVSTNFPSGGTPAQKTNGGDYDAFISKFIPDGSALQYSGYLGGSGDDYAYAVAVNGAGEATIAGFTASADFPTVNPAQHAYAGGNSDAFVARFNADGSTLDYATYLGGTGDDQARGVAVDGDGNAYVAGYTTSTNFPIARPYRNINEGGNDAFVTKLGANPTTTVASGGSGGAASPALLLLGLAAWARRRRQANGVA